MAIFFRKMDESFSAEIMCPWIFLLD